MVMSGLKQAKAEVVTASSTWETGWVEVSSYDDITGWISTSGAGSLTVIFSDDGSTERFSDTLASHSGADDTAFSYPVILPYAKIKFTETSGLDNTVTILPYLKGYSD